MERHRSFADGGRSPGILVLLALLAALTGCEASAQAARDYVSIVGSSTVYPFSTVVAERFGRNTSFRTPTVESTGTGGGFKLFCGGIGVEHPDITNASRRIKQSEVDDCTAHGVMEIVEVQIGYDGIVLANSRAASHIDLRIEQVFLALAKNVPDPADPAQIVPNPYGRWSEISPDRKSTRLNSSH